MAGDADESEYVLGNVYPYEASVGLSWSWK